MPQFIRAPPGFPKSWSQSHIRIYHPQMSTQIRFHPRPVIGWKNTKLDRTTYFYPVISHSQRRGGWVHDYSKPLSMSQGKDLTAATFYSLDVLLASVQAKPSRPSHKVNVFLSSGYEQPINAASKESQMLSDNTINTELFHTEYLYLLAILLTVLTS